jgi:formylglycine-generating enzyme required for sulfatase activity
MKHPIIVIGLMIIFTLVLTACGATTATPIAPAQQAPATAAPATVAPATAAPTTAAPATAEPTTAPTPTTAATLAIGSTWTRPADGMVMVPVPEGEFTMGLSADKALEICQRLYDNCIRSSFTDEEPSHTVLLDAYWIDQTEVTNAMYSLCVKSGSCQPPHSTTAATRPSYYGDSYYGDYPVIFVDWNQANTYCQWAGARLPSEAEWEKAARGTNADVYPWGSYDPGLNLANYRTRGNNNGDTVKVGTYPAGKSIYGAYDLIGNVAEWVADWYAENYYSTSPSSNPKGPDSGDARVIRGGAWYTIPGFFSTTYRDKLPPWNLNDGIGFRCARPAN